LLPLSFQPLFQALELRPSRAHPLGPPALAPLVLLLAVAAVVVAELAPPSYHSLRTLV
jgi:hypothetical protein